MRSWEMLYVALAEALDATLVTTDGRLAGADGPRRTIEVLGTTVRERNGAVGPARERVTTCPALPQDRSHPGASAQLGQRSRGRVRWR